MQQQASSSRDATLLEEEQENETTNTTTITALQDTRERKHICPECNKGFLLSWHLKRHMRLHTSDGRPEECPICKQRFTKKRALRLHVSKEHAKNPEQHGTTPEAINAILKCKPFACTFAGCTKTFSTEGQMKKHLKKHDEKRHICGKENCGQAFAFRKDLLKHIKASHPLTEQDLTCAECNQVFKTKDILGAHMRNVHVAPKSFPCPHEGCDKVYNKKANLKLHVKRVHDKTEHGIWLCSVCTSNPDGYVSKYCLIKHYQNIHGMERTLIDEQIKVIMEKFNSGAITASPIVAANKSDEEEEDDDEEEAEEQDDGNSGHSEEERSAEEPPKKKRKYNKAMMNSLFGESTDTILFNKA